MGLWNFLTRDRSNLKAMTCTLNFNEGNTNTGTASSEPSLEVEVKRLSRELKEIKKLLKYKTGGMGINNSEFRNGYYYFNYDILSSPSITFPDGTIRKIKHVAAKEEVVDEKPSKKKAKGGKN